MNCPLCNSDSRVLRKDDEERRRECLKCKHRWPTVEVHKEAHERMRSVVDRVKELAHDVAGAMNG